MALAPQNVLIRRSKYRLGKIEHRLEILEGYLVVFLNLDEVIASSGKQTTRVMS